MKLSFRKTETEQLKLTRYIMWVSFLVLGLTLWHIFATNSQTPDVNAANYENVVQSHIMFFKLKIGLGLFALGTMASYGLTWMLTHTPLGRWMFQWSESQDDSNSKAAKSLSLGLVFAASIIGVFTLLSSVIGK